MNPEPCPPKLQHLSVNEVENYWKHGVLSTEEVTQYLRAWNTSGKHFSQAVLWDGAIRLFDPEKSPNSYRHLEAEFCLQLPPPKIPA